MEFSMKCNTWFDAKSAESENNQTRVTESTLFITLVKHGDLEHNPRFFFFFSPAYFQALKRKKKW